MKLFNPQVQSKSSSANTSSNSSPSVPVATKLATKAYTTCALMSDQTVRCWGENTYGALGNGVTAPSGTPVQVSGLTGATDIAVGFFHSCAVISGGGVKCWGFNDSGQLGDGTSINRTTPVSVSGLAAPAIKVATGLHHTCAILSASPWVQCWGTNANSELGNAGAGGGSTVPVSVALGAMPTSAAPTAIDAGYDHTCVIDGSASKNIWCWGYNSVGQLGNNTTVNSATAVKAGTVSAASLTLSYNFSCAAAAAGTIWCWGDGGWGEFESNSGYIFHVPTQSANLGSNAWQVTAGVQLGVTYTSGCAVLNNGNVTCWGSELRGNLGDGIPGATWHVAPFNHPYLSGIKQVVGGSFHMCALGTTGSVQCWGHNGLGSLGIGSISPQTPVTVAGINTAVQVVGSKSGEWQCARLSNGDVYCWGSTECGLDGNGVTGDVNTATPVKVPNASMGAALDLSIGSEEACIVNTSNQVWCWGLDRNFTLSSSNTGSALAPTQQPGISGAQKIFVGYHFACATLSGAPYVKCWGDNTYGQLGNGAVLPGAGTYTPQSVAGFTATPALIGGTQNSVCATISGAPYLKCWGVNGEGELGDNTINSNSTPVNAVAVGLAAVPIDLSRNGSYATCAVTAAGGMKCWGGNNNYNDTWTWGTFSGMLGDGTTNNTGTGSAATAGTPSAIAGASNVGGGGNLMCAIFNPGASGTVDCWGKNNFGQAGTAPGPSAFNRVTLSGSGYVSISGSDNTTCALMNNNTVQCWGEGSGGQLGDGAFRSKFTPQAVSF